ncbi:GNAT family N-acetyltransferase [Pseudovibrio sp. JE062]|uniref:GNAT family N-acetyltransferase n=1 Tax=Pseudovibrio sp. JE062 TaxID=439495 RepID=UPI000566DD18|nr:GNAT family N-acetyltransferase [Pseudovibrio sp. JE062]
MKYLHKIKGIALRAASLSDALSIWQWRNLDDAYKFYGNAEYVPYEKHIGWFRKALNDEDRYLLIAELEGDPIAHIRFDLEDTSATVSICMAGNAKGKKLSRPSLEVSCDYIMSKGYTEILASIHEMNLASIRLFRSLDFELETSSPPFLNYCLRKHREA